MVWMPAVGGMVAPGCRGSLAAQGVWSIYGRQAAAVFVIILKLAVQNMAAGMGMGLAPRPPGCRRAPMYGQLGGCL